MIRELARTLRQMPAFYTDRFAAWSKDLDLRSRSGEFGKWPWQEQYGLWPWQRRRKRDQEEN